MSIQMGNCSLFNVIGVSTRRDCFSSSNVGSMVSRVPKHARASQFQPSENDQKQDRDGHRELDGSRAGAWFDVDHCVAYWVIRFGRYFEISINACFKAAPVIAWK